MSESAEPLRNLIKVIMGSRYRCVLAPLEADSDGSLKTKTERADGMPEPLPPSFGASMLADNSTPVNREA